MSAHDQIQAFLMAVRARLEQARGRRVFSWAVLLAAAGLLLWCLGWVVQGYAVPRWGYLGAALAGVVLFVGLWLWRRTSTEKAAQVADAHFALKDALVSFLGFHRQSRQGEFFRLDTEQTAGRVATLSVNSLPVVWPRRTLALGVLLLTAAGVMAFSRPSPEVQERLALEDQTTLKTAEINEELTRQMEELLKEAGGEDEELLKPDEWRRWVQELSGTKDQKEALRQYAELERRLQEAAQRLTTRQQEQLLSKAGQELQQDRELRETGRKMEGKNYRGAAEELQKLALNREMETESMDEARKELARMKSAAQRMAAAARSYQQRQKNGGGPGAQGQPSASGQGQSGSSMEQAMLGLEQAVQQYEKSLQQGQNQNQNAAQAKNQANQQLQQLTQQMKRTATQRDLMKKLQSLCKSASQCQGYLCDKKSGSLSQCMGQKPGGQKPGSGSSEARRDESELTKDNGQRDQLQGTKGAGPSDTTTEEADSGTGTATRAVKAAERSWERQVESFIQREDVPTEVKDGVKEYFKGIQNVGEEGGQGKAQP